MIAHRTPMTLTDSPPGPDATALVAASAGYRPPALIAGAWDEVTCAAFRLPRPAVVRELRCELAGDGGIADQRLARDHLRELAGLAAQGLAAFGYLGFELGAALERRAVAPRGARSRDVSGRLYRHGEAGADTKAAAAAAGYFDAAADGRWLVFDPADLQPVAAARSGPEEAAVAGTSAEVAAWLAGLDLGRASFQRDVDAVLAAIADGRVYQVNLSRALPLPRRWAQAAHGADAAALWRALQTAQQVPYAAIIDLPAPGASSTPPERLICASMERLIRLTPTGPQGQTLASSRPIKGTVARSPEADGREHADDLRRRAALLASAKERAENTMIVDMVRHDLGRVARADGVRVRALCEAVAYRTLWHLESEVEADLAPGVDSAGLLEALLPPASVSGAPKIAAIEQIVALEARRRGPYCGAVGALWPDGRVELAVGIRQALIGPNGGELAVGAGIVADSDPAAEWSELLTKSRGIANALAALAALPGPRAPGVCQAEQRHGRGPTAAGASGPGAPPP